MFISKLKYWKKQLGPIKREADLIFKVIIEGKLTVVGLILVISMVVIAATASHIAPYDPIKQNLKDRLQPPNEKHWFGTDDLGRDILSRVMWGARVSLFAGITTVMLSIILGVMIGTISGYLGGKTDMIFMRIADMFMAFPAFILAVVISLAFGPNLHNALMALIVTWWPGYARIARGSVLSVKNKDYIEAAVAMGESKWNIIFRHILPNIQAPILITGTLDIGAIILATAGLSFIGAGVRPPTPEWGYMINSGRHFLSIAPWICAFPGLAIFLAVLGFNLLGDGLRDALDPRFRR